MLYLSDFFLLNLWQFTDFWWVFCRPACQKKIADYVQSSDMYQKLSVCTWSKMPDFLDSLQMGKSFESRVRKPECVKRADNHDINHTFIFMANLESRMKIFWDNVNCSISSCSVSCLTGKILYSGLYIHPLWYRSIKLQKNHRETLRWFIDLLPYSKSKIRPR